MAKCGRKVLLLENFIISLLNLASFPDVLKWIVVDKEFSIQWLNQRCPDSNKAEFVIFQLWDILKGRTPMTDSKSMTCSKTRFHSALHSLEKNKKINFIYKGVNQNGKTTQLVCEILPENLDQAALINNDQTLQENAFPSVIKREISNLTELRANGNLDHGYASATENEPTTNNQEVVVNNTDSNDLVNSTQSVENSHIVMFKAYRSDAESEAGNSSSGYESPQMLMSPVENINQPSNNAIFAESWNQISQLADIVPTQEIQRDADHESPIAETLVIHGGKTMNNNNAIEPNATTEDQDKFLTDNFMENNMDLSMVQSDNLVSNFDEVNSNMNLSPSFELNLSPSLYDELLNLDVYSF